MLCVKYIKLPDGTEGFTVGPPDALETEVIFVESDMQSSSQEIWEAKKLLNANAIAKVLMASGARDLVVQVQT